MARAAVPRHVDLSESVRSVDLESSSPRLVFAAHSFEEFITANEPFDELWIIPHVIFHGTLGTEVSRHKSNSQ